MAEPRNETRAITGPAIRAINEHFGARALADRRNSGLLRIGSRAIKLCANGTPDIEVLLDGGRSLWIETKVGDKGLTDDQRTWHHKAAALGHTVIVARSVQDAVDAVGRALR